MKALEKLKKYLNGEIDNFELSDSDKEVLALWIAAHEETDYEKLRKEVRDKNFHDLLRSAIHDFEKDTKDKSELDD